MDKDLNKICTIADTLSYEIYCVQMRSLYSRKAHLNYKIKIKTDHFATFLVQTCIIEDLYMLYFMNNNIIEKYNYAHIPDYKTSVFMNSLFRNVRENINLDYIEESEDEEIFENIDADKLVFLKKKIKIKCMFCPKMKLWNPIEVSNENLTTKNFIYNVEKK